MDKWIWILLGLFAGRCGSVWGDHKKIKPTSLVRGCHSQGPKSYEQFYWGLPPWRHSFYSLALVHGGDLSSCWLCLQWVGLCVVCTPANAGSLCISQWHGKSLLSDGIHKENGHVEASAMRTASDAEGIRRALCVWVSLLQKRRAVWERINRMVCARLSKPFFFFHFYLFFYFWGWPWTDSVVQMALNSKWFSCLVLMSARITSVFPSLQLWKSLLLKTKIQQEQNQTTTPRRSLGQKFDSLLLPACSPVSRLASHLPVSWPLLGHLVYKPSVLSFPPRPFPESSLFLCSLIFWISLASCSSDAANQTPV